MPEFIVKKGRTSKEFKDYWSSLKDEKYFRVRIDKDTKDDRMRRSYRALIKAVHESGEFSVQINGKYVSSYQGLHDHYKLCGCLGEPAYYQLGTFITRDLKEITDHLTDPTHHNWVVHVPKSWTAMDLEEKNRTLSILITDVKLSGTSNTKVQEWISKITKEFL